MIGTAFRVNYKTKRLIVTAKHLFPSLNGNIIIEIGEINQNGTIDYVPIPSECSMRCHKVADIAIIDFTDTTNYLNNHLPIQMNYKPIQYDKLVMVGFPTSVRHENRVQGSRYPLPYFKSMYLSNKCRFNGIELLFLDTISSSGFSGSPVFVKLGENNYEVVGVQVQNYSIVSRTIEPINVELINGIYFRDSTHIAGATIIDYIDDII